MGVTPTKLIIVEQIQKGQKRFAANLGGLCRLGDAKKPRMPIVFVAIDVVGMVRLKPHQLTSSVLAHVLVKAAFAKVASGQQSPDTPKWTIALNVPHGAVIREHHDSVIGRRGMNRRHTPPRALACMTLRQLDAIVLPDAVRQRKLRKARGHGNTFRGCERFG